MRRRRLRLAVAALAVLPGTSLIASPAGAAHAPGVRTGVTAGVGAWKTFTWDHDLHAGDCTMFAGATWTIYDNGNATFDGKVTSSDNNDAWLMQAYLLNSQLGQLEQLENNTPDTWEKI